MDTALHRQGIEEEMTGFVSRLPEGSPCPPSKPLITKPEEPVITISAPPPVTPKPAATTYTVKRRSLSTINSNYPDCCSQGHSSEPVDKQSWGLGTLVSGLARDLTWQKPQSLVSEGSLVLWSGPDL